MKIILNKKTETCLIRVAKITENLEELYNQIKIELNDQEKSFYNSFKNNKRKKEWLSIRILLKDILGYYSEIKYDTLGNPYISLDYQISITHSKDIAGLILKKGDRTGIDSEFISDRILRTAHKFITEEDLSILNDKNKLKGIYMHWCCKETIFKIIGGGGIDFKKNLFVKFTEIYENGSVLGTFNTTKHTESFEINYAFFQSENNELLITWH